MARELGWTRHVYRNEYSFLFLEFKSNVFDNDSGRGRGTLGVEQINWQNVVTKKKIKICQP